MAVETGCGGGGGSGDSDFARFITIDIIYFATKCQKEAEEGTERSKTLFVQHLSPKQLRNFNKKGYIIVKGNKGNTYCIYTTYYTSNVFKKTSFFGWNEVYCIHLNNYSVYPFPLYDHILAQKLLLETNEDLFLRTAYKRRTL